jgi:ABC-2 type transport system permease protein
MVVAAFFRRDWRIDISYRAGYILQLASVFFALILFFYLGHVIDKTKFATHNGASGGYFGYVVVGLALLEVLHASISSFSRRMREEQTTGTLEALMSTPTRPSLIVLSSAAYELLRALINGVLFVVVAVLFFGLRFNAHPTSALTAILALAGCLGLFASLGVAVGAFTIVFKQAPALLGMIVAAVALLGGVYYPISVLPGGIRWAANALPFTWGLDALRSSLLGGHVNLALLAGLFACAAALLPLALWCFGMALRQARRTGGLSQY